MASPRTSAAPRPTEVREEETKKEGLSVATLAIAALSSATAAIIVSHFWERGTIVASAMTPVVVAIVADLLRKPVESDVLKSSVRGAASLSRPRSGRTPKVMRAPEPEPGRTAEDSGGDNGREPGPVRVYSSGSHRRPRGAKGGARRKLHPKVAVVTGLVAFLIAAAAMTLPELLFDGSVGGGDRNTTFFGGGSKSSDRGEEQDGVPQDGRPDAPTQQDPAAPPPDGGDASPDPEQSEPTPPTPTTPPESPTQPAPDSGGTTSP